MFEHDWDNLELKLTAKLDKPITEYTSDKYPSQLTLKEWHAIMRKIMADLISRL